MTIPPKGGKPTRAKGKAGAKTKKTKSTASAPRPAPEANSEALEPKAKRHVDWESIEAQYIANQLSVRAIANAHGIAESGIRKKAAAEGWQRALSDKVRKVIRENLVRSDGAQSGAQKTDRELIAAAALVGADIITSHRKSLQQLHDIKKKLAGRLAAVIDGNEPDGPCLGSRETPSNMLLTLSRVTALLIPLERQAHNLDDGQTDDHARIEIAWAA